MDLHPVDPRFKAAALPDRCYLVTSGIFEGCLRQRSDNNTGSKGYSNPVCTHRDFWDGQHTCGRQLQVNSLGKDGHYRVRSVQCIIDQGERGLLPTNHPGLSPDIVDASSIEFASVVPLVAAAGGGDVLHYDYQAIFNELYVPLKTKVLSQKQAVFQKSQNPSLYDAIVYQLKKVTVKETAAATAVSKRTHDVKDTPTKKRKNKKEATAKAQRKKVDPAYHQQCIDVIRQFRQALREKEKLLLMAENDLFLSSRGKSFLGLVKEYMVKFCAHEIGVPQEGSLVQRLVPLTEAVNLGTDIVNLCVAGRSTKEEATQGIAKTAKNHFVNNDGTKISTSGGDSLHKHATVTIIFTTRDKQELALHEHASQQAGIRLHWKYGGRCYTDRYRPPTAIKESIRAPDESPFWLALVTVPTKHRKPWKPKSGDSSKEEDDAVDKDEAEEGIVRIDGNTKPLYPIFSR